MLLEELKSQKIEEDICIVQVHFKIDYKLRNKKIGIN